MKAAFRFALTLTALLAVAACNEQVVVEEPAVPAPDEEIDEGPVDPPPPLYIGVWAADEDACDVPPGEPGPVVFTASQFVGYENTCSILASEEGTDGGWRLSMRCEAEGMTTDEVADADVDGERLRLSRNGGEPVVFIRCADAQTSVQTQ